MNLDKTVRPDAIDSDRLIAALLRENFAAFTQKCFYEVNGGQTFHDNWHVRALAWHLSQVATGDIKRLLITLPPRSLKSISASVAFPAWLIGREPERRIICASYADQLAIAHANSFRRVVVSQWYRDLFPLMRVDRRKDTEREVHTTRNGYRLTTTIGGTLTGRGGSVIIIDDPMKAADAKSESSRTSVKTWFSETVLSRLDNKNDDAIIVVMQRLHVDDLAGHVLQTGDWTHLTLPAIAESCMRVATGPGTGHVRKIGDVLQPGREPKDKLDQLKKEMGSASFSAQYQQQPVPPEGDRVKWRWFGIRATLADPEQKYPRLKIVQSWDTASKASELSDYCVCVTAEVLGDDVHIIDVFRKRLEYPDLRRQIIARKQRWSADTVLIEDAGSGTSLIQDLQRERIRTIAIKPEGDKIVRMDACTAQLEAGHVSRPREAPWLDEFRDELRAFPNGKHDDQADALSQLLNWVARKARGYTLDNL